jgi:predicted nucleic acid-binding Zn ribbon protein
MVMYAVLPLWSREMKRWCPSCRKAWPPDRVVCPDCLVDLVDDPDATVRCRHCGREWPATMVSCPVCLAELRPDPEAAAEALGEILALGGRLLRPDGTPPFAAGPACTLLRLSGRGGLVFSGPSGLLEARVESDGGRAEPPLTCRDHDGTLLFSMRTYDAAPSDALVAFSADGAALATYLRAGTGIDVRDETSAPVASLRRARGRFELVETGAGVLATVGSMDAEVDRWVDDQWWLEPAAGAGRLPLRPLAAVALVLAAKVLLGRPWPVRVPAAHPEDEGSPFE